MKSSPFEPRRVISGTTKPFGPRRRIVRSASQVMEMFNVTVTLVTTSPAGGVTVIGELTTTLVPSGTTTSVVFV